MSTETTSVALILDDKILEKFTMSETSFNVNNRSDLKGVKKVGSAFKLTYLFHLPHMPLYEPRRENTCLWGFRPGATQTRLYNHRRWLEA